MICIGTSSGWNNIRIGLLRRTSSGYPMFSVSDGSSAVQYNCTATTFTLDTWNHIACIYKNGEIKIYLNGILNKTYTTTITPVLNSSQHLGIGAASNGAEKLTGYLNDVRIYDHALSQKEVEEIAKGLVVHYKLSENRNVMANVYSYPTFNTSSANGGWSHWGGSGHAGSFSQNTNKEYIYDKSKTYSHLVSDGASGTKDYLVYQSPAFDGGYRSLQCICKEANSLPISDSFFYPDWNARDGGAAAKKWTSITHLGDGFYLCKCEGIHQNGSNNLIGFYVKVGYSVYISEAYCENDREICSDIFSQTNLADVNDSSGYGNNGTFSNSSNIKIITDPPKYSYGIHLSKTKINCTTGFPSSDNPDFTVVFWTRIFSDITYVSYGDLTGMYDTGQGNNTFRLELCGSPASNNIMWFRGPSGQSSGGFNMNSSSSSGWFSKDTWHQIALTGNGQTKQYICYLDGVQCGTYNGSANSWSPTGQFYIGDTVEATADFSDYRIYATALTPEQIKELYNTSATIDNNGNVYAREVIE